MRSPLPADAVARACDRAAAYRRDLAMREGRIQAGASPSFLLEHISGEPATRAASLAGRDPDHWHRVGRVVDHSIGHELAVWWQPRTDRVRVAAPAVWTPPAPAPPGPRQLRGTGNGGIAWTARPGYVHRDAEGRPRCAACATKRLNAGPWIGSIASSDDGWRSDPLGVDDPTVCIGCGRVIAMIEAPGGPGDPETNCAYPLDIRVCCDNIHVCSRAAHEGRQTWQRWSNGRFRAGGR